MTFGRLLLAGLPVAGWFALAAWARFHWRVRTTSEAALSLPPLLSARVLGWMVAEVVVITLFASLWFDSLGSGGWWLLFGLVGFLVGFPSRMAGIPDLPEVRRLAFRDAVYDVARYVGAGALLAWGLG